MILEYFNLLRPPTELRFSLWLNLKIFVTQLKSSGHSYLLEILFRKIQFMSIIFEG